METKQMKQFFHASRTGNLEELITLIQSGTNVNIEDYNGNTALLHAAKKGHTACISALIEAGANINAKNVYGNTALLWAGINNISSCILQLVELGADVNARNIFGYTPLSLAVDNNMCVSELIEAGADMRLLHTKDKNYIIKNNICKLDNLRNNNYNRRKNALLFYKTQYLDSKSTYADLH